MSAATSSWRCGGCGWSAAADPLVWACPSCQSPLDCAGAGAVELDPRELSGSGLCRYASWLGLGPLPRLGEPTTPLVELTLADGSALEAKHEGMLPSGSFKDRGAAALVAWLSGHGVERAVVDSSGNAGAALAAYAARAGIACEVFVPARTSPLKLRQCEAYGATVRLVPGSREDAASAALDRAAGGVAYASHKWSPVFLLGVQTLIFELWEQRGRTLPDFLVMPVGAGSLLLGVADSCEALLRSGLVDRVPRLVGVQSAACAPVAARFDAAPVPEDPGASGLAEGVQIASPPRLEQIVAAIERSGGTCLAVAEDDVRAAQQGAAAAGVLIEPTSALALAGWSQARNLLAAAEDESAVAVLTATGLKTLFEEAP